jgi:hypothetical protein
MRDEESLDSYLYTRFGIRFRLRAARDAIDTIGALRKVAPTVLQTVLSDMFGDVETLADATPDGPRDRVLKILYELGAPLPRDYLLRYHAVYEWAIAQRETRDTEISVWERWLTPGREISLKMWTSAGARYAYSRVWTTISEKERADDGDRRFIRVRGKVLRYTAVPAPTFASPDPQDHDVIDDEEKEDGGRK